MKFWLLFFVLSAILAVELFSFATSKSQDEDKPYFESAAQKYQIYVPYLPEQLSLANEKVDIDNVFIRERIEREVIANMYRHSFTILMFKRSARFFPMFDKKLEENGIPLDFKYLALAESELSNVVSPAGAAGIWQFMKTTAVGYGLEVNADIDERYHYEKSTVAACRLLKDLYSKYGNWALAAAAYNAGPATIDKAINEQSRKNYYDLYLNQETSRYVPRITAIKLVMEFPRRYGFFLRNKDLYQPIPSKKITVDSTITNLMNFAKQMGVTYYELKEMNPWLRSNKLPNAARKKYEIEIPAERRFSVIVKNISDPQKLIGDSL